LTAIGKGLRPAIFFPKNYFQFARGKIWASGRIVVTRT
jgi:hypothetical protein